jgi:hypothetical protein
MVAKKASRPKKAPPEPVRRGRPPDGATAMTKAERNRLWRANKGIVGMEIPHELAERVRRLRSERGETTAELLSAALDALERRRVSRSV